MNDYLPQFMVDEFFVNFTGKIQNCCYQIKMRYFALLPEKLLSVNLLKYLLIFRKCPARKREKTITENNR